ncbi:ABC transporter permease [Bacteroidota bacterium]
MKNFLIDLKEGILISIRAIRANKMRSVLTTLGIIIGIFAVTTMSTAIVGLREAFVSSISSLGNDVLYVDKFEWGMGGNYHLYRNRKNLDYSQYEKLKDRLTSYDAISPVKRTFGKTLKYKNESVQSSLVIGTNEDYLKTGNAIPEKGRFLSELDVKANRAVCVIGQDIADALFPNVNPLNKQIKVSGKSLRVIGILEKQGSALFGSFSMDGQLILPIKVYERFFGDSRNRMRIDIKVADVNKIEDSKEEIRQIMRVIRKVPPGEEDDFAINQQEAITEVYDQTVGIVGLAGIVITGLSLFVGAIGIMNIMFVSVTERTREIGIRKAVGAKTWSILIQFLAEAALICMIGGLIGLFISFPVSLIIDQFLPTAMPLDIVILSLFIAAVVGIISGFLPAFKASKLDPVEALRYE